MNKKIILAFFILLILPSISAYVIHNASAGNNVVFRSIGLNSQVTISFPINFSRTDVNPDSITFYDLTYIHPSSCNGITESTSLYNYTTANSNVTSDVFPYTACAVAPAPSAPSGGGGGGGYAPKVISFKVNKEEIKTTVKQGAVVTEEIVITNLLNSALDVNISVLKIEDLVRVRNSIIHLAPKESRIITFEIIAESSTVPDLYIGEIVLKANGDEKNILTGIEVESAQPLFDISVKIPDQFLYVLPDEDVIGEFEVYNLGEINKEVDVNLEYKILDSRGNEILKESENIAVNTKISFIKSFRIPANSQYGRYVLYVKATYNQRIASGSAWFNVGKAPTIPFELATIAIAILILMIVIIILVRRKIKKEKKPIKRVSDKALKRANILKR